MILISFPILNFEMHFLRKQFLKGKKFSGSNFLMGENIEMHFLREQGKKVLRELIF